MEDVSCETLLGYGQTVWRHDVHDVAVPFGVSVALVEKAFAWRCATGERETGWCKRGVSLVRWYQECPKRVPRKSFLQE